MEKLVKKSFWKGKRVFLTGHTGFKGTWLSLWLNELGAVVKGYALEPNTVPSLFEQFQMNKDIESIIADIRNLDQLKIEICSFKPDIVIHLAAQPLVRLSYNEPVMTYETNVMGTVNLLESVRFSPSVRAVVNVTTDKCYENNEWHWGYRENEPLGGFDPYSNSKGCSELVTSSYRNSFFNKNNYQQHGVAVASGRAGNVIGGGDWAEDRLIPDILNAFGRKETVIIRSPKAIRPWQHVLEPLSGYLCLAQKLFEDGPDFAEPWNFGPNDSDAQPVSWIVDKMMTFWGEGAQWKLDEADQPHEASYLKLDCSKAKSRLSWQPQWDLSEALKRLTHWHKNYLDGKDMKRHSLSEIKDYCL